MGKIVGEVLTEKGHGIGTLLVTAYALTGNVGGSAGRRQRLAAVTTGVDGSFRVEHSSGHATDCALDTRWDLLVTVETGADKSDETEIRRSLLATEAREDASSLETFRFIISDSRLSAASIVLAPDQRPENLIARESAARDIRKKFKEENLRHVAEALGEARARRDTHTEGFRTFLRGLSLQRASVANGYLRPEADIIQENLGAMRRMITQDLPRATAVNHAILENNTIDRLKAQYGPALERVPASAIEAVAWPWKKERPGRIVAKSPWRTLCGGPPPDDCVKLLENEPVEGDPAEPNSPPAITNIRVTDVAPTSARISWTTEQPADTKIEYGTTAAYGFSTALDTTLVNAHSQVLSDLHHGTTYHYRIEGMQGNGTAVTSSDLTFNTTELPSIEALVHVQEDMATSAEVLPMALRSRVSDVQQNVDSFLLRSGPADAPAFFDFHHLRIAFQPVWQELFDTDLVHTAHELYSRFVELGIDANDYLDGPLASTLHMGSFAGIAKKIISDAQANISSPIHPHVVRVFEITDAQWNVLEQPLRDELIAIADIAGGWQPAAFAPDAFYLTFPENALPSLDRLGWLDAYRRQLMREGRHIIEYATRRVDSGSQNNLDDFHQLLKDLDASMKQPYRFNVYAANRNARSINFGVVVTYRQRWEPVAYQVGELVKTIPLAPKESRRFTKKTIVRHSRAEKEVNNSLQSRRTESSDTWRAESQIVSKATSKTNFQLGAQGGVNLGIGNVSGSTAISHDAATESEEVKKDFREAVFKATEEYKQERTLQIETSESVEATVEESGEINNPNDEIPVTYLFYQLQRRYRVNEQIRSVAPVILVAQEFPKPDQIDEDWIVAHDWILRRTLLDDSFGPALNYLSTKIVGDEVALRELFKNVEQHRRLVDDLKDELISIHSQVNSRYKALEVAMARHADAVQADEEGGGIVPVGGFLIPTGGGDAPSPEAMRLNEDAARDAFERAAKQEKEMQARLDREATALEAITDTYTRQLSDHLNRRAQIARLRVHIKENIFYYMQAIWSYEPNDQRFFRLHDVPVPRLIGEKTYKIEPDADAMPMPPDWTTPHKLTLHATIDPDKLEFDMLGEIADLDNLLGFKGNFMIFPMREGNDVHDFMMAPYLGDRLLHVVDPDPLGNWTLHDFIEYVCCLRKTLSREVFTRRLPALMKVYARLKQLGASDDELIVPSDSLYIEALPGVRPVLEDFKLLHRAVDVKKAQAEVRAAELENVRMAARLFAGEREDPTIEKKIVVENVGTTILGSDA